MSHRVTDGTVDILCSDTFDTSMAGKIALFAKILRRQILINSKFDRQKTRKDMIILLLGSRKLSVRQIRQTGMKERH